MHNNDPIGIVILAAGGSLRMGQPKQLLAVDGVSLIGRAAQAAIDANCGPVIAVLGANVDLIRPILEPMEVEVAVNEDWAAGMSGSIQCGLRALEQKFREIKGVILMLADQPKVTASSIRKLGGARADDDDGLVAVQYADGVGTPAYFPREYFDELRQLTGSEGAKGVLQRHAERVVTIELPEAALDLDTPEDFARFVEDAQQARCKNLNAQCGAGSRRAFG